MVNDVKECQLLLGWGAGPSKSYSQPPPPSFTPSHPYEYLMHVLNGTVKLTCLFQEHNPGSNPELESSVGTNRPPHVRQAWT